TGGSAGANAQQQTPLQVSGFSSSYSASGGVEYQPTISLSGSGFSSVIQIVWQCRMPSGQGCADSPYTWTPSSWKARNNFVVYNDNSAMAAPKLLVAGDPIGTYQ